MSLTMTTLFSSVVGDIPVVMAFINNLSAAVDPAVGNDTSQGYVPGSTWINTTAKRVFVCTAATAGAAVWNETSSASSPGELIAPAASTVTGNGLAALVKGGNGGATSGNGGPNNVQGGDAVGTNSNGGDVNLAGGAKTGSGVAGVVRVGGVELVTQGAASEQDAGATLTAANLLAGIIESNPSGAINLQLPLATALDTALPTSVAGDAFDFSVISVAGSTTIPTITTNTGWTLVGAMSFTAVAGNAGWFRAAKTGAGAWTLFRLA
jgi:hypothetical protein